MADPPPVKVEDNVISAEPPKVGHGPALYHDGRGALADRTASNPSRLRSPWLVTGRKARLFGRPRCYGVTFGRKRLVDWKRP